MLERLNSFADRQGLAVLDFGCGDAIANYVHDLFHIKLMVGVDTVQYGSSHNTLSEDEHRVTTLREAARVCTQYELVIASFVLHHLPKNEITRVLTDFRRLTRQGGVMLIIEDDPGYPRAMTSDFDRAYGALSAGERHEILAMNDYWSNVVIYRRSADDQYHNYKATGEWQKLTESTGFATVASQRFGFNAGRLHGVPCFHLGFTC